MKHPRILRLALFLALSAWLPHPSMANEPLALHLLLSDGTSHVFNFVYLPEVTFAGDKLTVTSTQDAVTVEIDNVQEFHFGDIATDIDEPVNAARSVINIADGEVIVTNATLPNIGIFDISGRKLSPSVRQQSDGVSISLRSLPTGIYIIRFNNQSVKVTKR